MNTRCMFRERFRQVLVSITLFAIIAVITGGCGESKSRLSDRRSSGRGGKISVDAVVIQPQPLENKIYATGTILANEEVELRPEVSGRVIGVFFEEGGRVKKGQLLVKINDSELKAELKRKELEEKLASDEESRKRSLFDIHGISQEEYDKAVNALRMVQAEKEVVQSQLAETEIMAPFDGIIGLRHVSEGSFVTNNMLVATMQDVDPVKVEFSIPEKYARQIRKSTVVVVSVGDTPGERVGHVYAVESKIDPGTRTIKARATIPNPGEDLIPGSFAKVEIALENLPDAIVIPAEAIIPELNGVKVFTCRDGQARSVSVKTGIRTERSVQITDGLTAGDTLILTGLLQLSDGLAVKINNLRSGRVTSQ